MRATPILAGFLLCGCHDGDSDSTGFDPFVTDLIQNQTTETGEPVEVEGRDFSFPADDTAFDDVLPPDTGPVVPQ